MGYLLFNYYCMTMHLKKMTNFTYRASFLIVFCTDAVAFNGGTWSSRLSLFGERQGPDQSINITRYIILLCLFLLVLSSFFLLTKFMISWNFDQGRGGEGLPLVSGEEGAFQGGGDRLLLLFFFT